jgi:hypothetical protein
MPSTRSYEEKREARERAPAELGRAVDNIRLVGSLEIVGKVERLLQVASQGMSNAARGYPVDSKLGTNRLRSLKPRLAKTSATRALELLS